MCVGDSVVVEKKRFGLWDGMGSDGMLARRQSHFRYPFAV